MNDQTLVTTPPDLPTAEFTIAITTFRPLGGVFPISARLALTPGTTPEFPVIIDGTNITIEPPTGVPVELVFNLAQPAYVLLGMAFSTNTAFGSVGQTTFPDINIRHVTNDEGVPVACKMTVIDNSRITTVQQQSFNYIILVQDVASSEIGIIDPRIVNKPGPPP